MIIYLCIKYESNRPMHSKDMARKPYVRTDRGDAICPPTPIKNGGGIKTATYCFSVPYICSFFFLLNENFCRRFPSSSFVYTFRLAKCIVYMKIKMLKLILPSFSNVQVFPLSHMGIFCQFSQQLLDLGVWNFVYTFRKAKCIVYM